jgi:hypothetical protein
MGSRASTASPRGAPGRSEIAPRASRGAYSRTMNRRFVASLAAVASLSLGVANACGENLVTAMKMTVPPVRRVPLAVEGAIVRVAEDAAIETHKPEYQQRARDTLLPQQLRAEMTRALRDAGFVVVTEPAAEADLVAHLAFNVSDVGGHPRQLYRCKLTSADGEAVEAVDWVWPAGTFVEDDEVLEFASHNLVSEISKSSKLWAWFGAHPKGSFAQRPPSPPPPAPAPPVASDAGPALAPPSPAGDASAAAPAPSSSPPGPDAAPP